MPIFLEACAGAGVARVVQQSIAMVHAGGGDAWADEDTRHAVAEDTIAGRAIIAARDMEAAVAATKLDWLILRGALFYGPGTGFDDDWLARARAGKLRLPEAGEDYVTLVHIADMADATVAALSRWPSRQCLIVADDAPTRGATCSAMSPRPSAGRRLCRADRRGFPSFRLSNRRAREALAWSPRYPSYRVGLAR